MAHPKPSSWVLCGSPETPWVLYGSPETFTMGFTITHLEKPRVSTFV